MHELSWVERWLEELYQRVIISNTEESGWKRETEVSALADSEQWHHRQAWWFGGLAEEEDDFGFDLI